ncbi:hypothetical protein HAX54_046215 [Datura stramonium]|uniref:Uncharacterized protein n=1 Tax=Datura stramonium TaxID=4076 RepID=A0ABS8WJ56_DATST|nr:hypothetical protein [Datura stramonium]
MELSGNENERVELLVELTNEKDQETKVDESKDADLEELAVNEPYTIYKDCPVSLEALARVVHTHAQNANQGGDQGAGLVFVRPNPCGRKFHVPIYMTKK